MLTIQKHFPLGKGISVGSLALIAGFLGSVTVLNMLNGSQPSEPIAQVRPADNNGSVLGAEASKKTGNSTSSDAGNSEAQSTAGDSSGQIPNQSWSTKTPSLTQPASPTTQHTTTTTTTPVQAPASAGATTTSPTPTQTVVDPTQTQDPIITVPPLPLTVNPQIQTDGLIESEIDLYIN